jgi:Major Facilitator Superfamily
LDDLTSGEPRRRTRSALVRAALREFAERERRRQVEEREREIFRKRQKQLAREARLLVGSQARVTRGEIYKTRERVAEREGKPGFDVVVSRAFVAENDDVSTVICAPVFSPSNGSVVASVDFTPREAMRTAAFWLVSLGHGAALLVVSAVIVHMVTHVTERLGYSLAQAASVVALLTVAQIGGHLGGGWAGDRASKRVIAAGCMVGHAVALLLLAWASTYWMVIAFAGLHGLSWGTRGPLMAAIRADYFGAAAFGTISGVSSMVTMLGMMGGPLVAGILADRTGSYGPGFTVLALLALLGSVFFLLAKRPPPPARAPVLDVARSPR